jgi:hypothetical protein
MPAVSTVLLWVVKGDRQDETYKTFSEQYRCAREAQSEALLDEVIELADDAAGDYHLNVETDSGTIKAAPNIEHIQRSRLRIETRFRAAAKMHPRKFGEKVQQELTGPNGAPLAPPVVAVTPEAVRDIVKQVRDEF